MFCVVFGCVVPISEQCHVDEILGPGLLLCRIDGARTFRRVASLVTNPVPDPSEPTGHVKSEAKDMEADFS